MCDCIGQMQFFMNEAAEKIPSNLLDEQLQLTAVATFRQRSARKYF